MPSKPTVVTVPVFTPQPIDSPPIPQNPHMASNGSSTMHNDAYMSDTYAWPGPNGGRLRLDFGELSGLCPTLTFDRQGRIITVCSYLIGSQVTRELLMIDPDSLEVLASADLPPGGGGSSGFASGGYIYLDQLDRVVVPTANQQVMIFRVTDHPSFALARAYDLAPTIANPRASIQSALPDWGGRIWWVTDSGMVGYVGDGLDRPRAVQLPAPEQIANSFATDESGGVFVVSTGALYRFDVSPDGTPSISWRCAYDHGAAQKPGQQSVGSGTTPTLLGPSYLGITDNAEPRMHVLVYRREREVAGERLVGAQAVFAPGQSATENSLIGFASSFVVENNYGYTGTFSQPSGPTAPGLARVSFDPGGCALDWENMGLSIPSVVSKLSLANGLIYTYALDQREGRERWSIAAVDARSGECVYRVPAGEGLAYDNHYASLFIGPNGVVYVPVWSGLVSLRQL